MKGLLIKDFYVLFREARMFLLIVIIFAVSQQPFPQGFAIMYACMMPVTALAFDEQSKWDYYAEMMPYRRIDMVLSKYIVGFLGTLAATAIQIVSVLACHLAGIDCDLTLQAHLGMVLGFMVCGMVILAINLPVIFRIGSEKGRTLYLIVTMAVAMVCGILVTNFSNIGLPGQKLPPAAVAAAGIVIVILSQMVSIRVSIKAYTARRV